MSSSSSMFSESWYRVASQRLCLRPGVRVRRQNFRGERWFVLENPFTNEFYRMRPAAYEFVARLRADRSVGEVWQACLERSPDEAPGQEAVLQMLSQLYLFNLLQYDNASDVAALFSRQKKRQQQELRSRLLNIMFMRFPLLDPDRFLVRTLPYMGRLISAAGAALWLVVVGLGIKTVMDHFPALREQGQSVLTPANLPLLYVGLILIKTIHEFGHAYFCRKFGGEVHAMGVMLMIFTPVPYVDATSSWSFRERWKRVMVGLAGMIVELFVAAIASFVWARTAAGTVHNLAYNMMFVASVSTVVFNINPLLRFDGYYILSDLVGIPNLTQRAGRQLRYYAERYLFGLTREQSPALNRREGAWLSVYGVVSGVYRIFVFGGILLAIGDHFFLIGVVMAAVCFISWVTVPVIRFCRYLASEPRLERQRTRAVSVSAGLIAAALVLLQFIPFPSHFRAPGVVQATVWTEMVTAAAGQVVEMVAAPGSPVKMGQPLVRMVNPEIDLEMKQAVAAVQEVDARIRLALSGTGADLRPLRQRLIALSNRVEKLRYDQSSLVLTSRQDGLWVAPELKDAVRRWVPKGTRLGILVNPAAFRFTATVPQEDVDALFARHINGAEVRLSGQAAAALKITSWQTIPGAQRTLPSPALGWRGGGDVPVAPDDPHGQKAAEPFFEVRAEFAPTDAVAMLHGRSGRIRFDLDSEPLLPRAVRRLRQLLQKRYQL
ncbi:MAG: hypothetical protein HY299_10670 [Verrucomicrobia bacterium]|nr:hypothetical protein [Verrucomicrobiota bacterium]